MLCVLKISTSFHCRVPAGEIRIAFVLYKHIGVYLSTENASMKLGSEAMATNYSVIVNSPVITAAINKDSNKVYLSDPVIFTIRHLQVMLSLSFSLTLSPSISVSILKFCCYVCDSAFHLPTNIDVNCFDRMALLCNRKQKSLSLKGLRRFIPGRKGEIEQKVMHGNVRCHLFDGARTCLIC